MPGSSLGAGNIYSNIDDRWTPENPNQNVFWPRMGDKAVANNERPSTWWLRDMSFLAIEEFRVRLYSSSCLDELKLGLETAVCS